MGEVVVLKPIKTERKSDIQKLSVETTEINRRATAPLPIDLPDYPDTPEELQIYSPEDDDGQPTIWERLRHLFFRA